MVYIHIFMLCQISFQIEKFKFDLKETRRPEQQFCYGPVLRSCQCLLDGIALFPRTNHGN